MEERDSRQSWGFKEHLNNANKAIKDLTEFALGGNWAWMDTSWLLDTERDCDENGRYPKYWTKFDRPDGKRRKMQCEDFI